MIDQNPILFAFWWTLAHVVGFAVVKAFGDSSAVMMAAPRTRLLARGAVVGVAIGLAEWLVLRGMVDWDSRWALATVVGYAIGFPLGEVVQGNVGRYPRAGLVGKRILATCIVLAGTDTSLKVGIR